MLFENRAWPNSPIKGTEEVLSQTETKKSEPVANPPETREIIASVRLNLKNNPPSEIAVLAFRADWARWIGYSGGSDENRGLVAHVAPSGGLRPARPAPRRTRPRRG